VFTTAAPELRPDRTPTRELQHSSGKCASDCIFSTDFHPHHQASTITSTKAVKLIPITWTRYSIKEFSLCALKDHPRHYDLIPYISQRPSLKMPYLPTSQAFLEQSSLLLEAYPDSVRIFHSILSRILRDSYSFTTALLIHSRQDN
jgi:Signal recognition particle 9 kDa protein (SRP9).